MTSGPTAPSELIFHLDGGPQGPHLVRGSYKGPADDAAKALWRVTRNGTVGEQFSWYEPDGTSHQYKVIHKSEHAGEVHVTCLHVGEETEANSH